MVNLFEDFSSSVLDVVFLVGEGNLKFFCSFILEFFIDIGK